LGKPAGVASVGFHLQHIPGVLDRLFTYTRGQQLSDEQLKYLSAEGKKLEVEITINDLVQRFNDQVEKTGDQLKTMDESTLTEPRFVGRKQLPSTVLGLIFHSAEHTMRIPVSKKLLSYFSACSSPTITGNASVVFYTFAPFYHTL